MSEHFNNLTPAEQERLALLAEECAEVIQIVGKILRHGYESAHPNGGPSNRHLLEEEIAHVEVAAQLMVKAFDIDPLNIDAHEQAKLRKVGTCLHHNTPPRAAVIGGEDTR